MEWWAEKGRKGFMMRLWPGGFGVIGVLGREVWRESVVEGRQLFWVGSCGIRSARLVFGLGRRVAPRWTDGVRAGGRRAGGSAWLELRLKGEGL